MWWDLTQPKEAAMPKLTTTTPVDHTQGLTCATPMEGLIYQLALDLNRAEKQLVTKAESLARSMTQVASTVVKGGSTNSLGEVQGQGQELDRLCALRDQLTQQLQLLKATYARELETQARLAAEAQA